MENPKHILYHSLISKTYKFFGYIINYFAKLNLFMGAMISVQYLKKYNVFEFVQFYKMVFIYIFQYFSIKKYWIRCIEV